MLLSVVIVGQVRNVSGVQIFERSDMKTLKAEARNDRTCGLDIFWA